MRASYPVCHFAAENAATDYDIGLAISSRCRSINFNRVRGKKRSICVEFGTKNTGGSVSEPACFGMELSDEFVRGKEQKSLGDF